MDWSNDKYEMHVIARCSFAFIVCIGMVIRDEAENLGPDDYANSQPEIRLPIIWLHS